MVVMQKGILIIRVFDKKIEIVIEQRGAIEVNRLTSIAFLNSVLKIGTI